MGLAGGLYVCFIGYISPTDFDPIVTFQVWTMLIVGRVVVIIAARFWVLLLFGQSGRVVVG